MHMISLLFSLTAQIEGAHDTLDAEVRARETEFPQMRSQTEFGTEEN
jgi:hypothetical protein